MQFQLDLKVAAIGEVHRARHPFGDADVGFGRHGRGGWRHAQRRRWQLQLRRRLRFRLEAAAQRIGRPRRMRRMRDRHAGLRQLVLQLVHQLIAGTRGQRRNRQRRVGAQRARHDGTVQHPQRALPIVRQRLAVLALVVNNRACIEDHTQMVDDTRLGGFAHRAAAQRVHREHRPAWLRHQVGQAVGQQAPHRVGHGDAPGVRCGQLFDGPLRVIEIGAVTGLRPVDAQCAHGGHVAVAAHRVGQAQAAAGIVVPYRADEQRAPHGRGVHRQRVVLVFVMRLRVAHGQVADGASGGDGFLEQPLQRRGHAELLQPERPLRTIVLVQPAHGQAGGDGGPDRALVERQVFIGRAVHGLVQPLHGADVVAVA